MSDIEKVKVLIEAILANPRLAENNFHIVIAKIGGKTEEYNGHLDKDHIIEFVSKDDYDVVWTDGYPEDYSDYENVVFMLDQSGEIVDEDVAGLTILHSIVKESVHSI